MRVHRFSGLGRSVERARQQTLTCMRFVLRLWSLPPCMHACMYQGELRTAPTNARPGLALTLVPAARVDLYEQLEPCRSRKAAAAECRTGGVGGFATVVLRELNQWQNGRFPGVSRLTAIGEQVRSAWAQKLRLAQLGPLERDEKGITGFARCRARASVRYFGGAGSAPGPGLVCVRWRERYHNVVCLFTWCGFCACAP